MNNTIAVLHWILTTGILIFLWLVVICALGYALKLCWASYQNKRCFVEGHNSIMDQLKAGGKIHLNAPEPPAAWPAQRQIIFRSGQLKALAVLQAHNAKVKANLKRGLKRASAGIVKS
ncbi:MAG: hypothetical protein M0Q93_00105 [Terrimicrobiaceae bacterium]|jgi:hypothetical protein|nr:hypothetical protein [Terrimicrobiaceae bacterium]